MVDQIDQLGGDEQLLGVHLVLGEVLDIDFAEVAQPRVQSEKSVVDTFNLHAFQQLPAEMESGSRSDHSPFVTGKDVLITLGIELLDRTGDVGGQRHLAQLVECLLELVVRAVVEEPQRAAARGGVVNHLGHHRVVVAEIELVADTDFPGRLDQNVP